MTQNEFKKFREDILKGFQLTSTPTIKSVSALFFSGLISTYGIYSILLSVGITGNAMYKAIGIFILILIVADTFKRGALVKYYNSTIRGVIVGAKVLKMQLVISILALAFMTVFDIVGSFSTANYVEAKYQEFRATNSKEFELLETNAKNGQSALSIYSQELTTWQNDKRDGYQVCNEKWKGWKAKYKAKCKEEWNTANPKPVKPTQNGSVSVADYQSVKEGANDDFLSEYIFYIILFLSMALTMLLQYTTISEIQDKKDEIDQSLTSMVIGILQDRLKELESNMIEHETQRNELISDSDKEEKRLGRDFETRGKAIGLLALGKAVDARGETVKRIANNESFPTGDKKAGFVVNPLYKEPKEENEGLSKKDILELLFNDIDSRKDNKLTSKTKIIDVTNRTEDRHYKEVMKILKDNGIVEFKRGHGYYAIKSYKEALNALKGAK
jgi:uncharacterized membrane protein